MRAKQALLVVDVLKEFEYEDGDHLLASFRARHGHLAELLESAREQGLEVVYGNDAPESADSAEVVRRALAGKGGKLVATVAPRPSEPVVLKRRYSAFDETTLAALLDELGVTE